jgi:putative MFS transporter
MVLGMLGLWLQEVSTGGLARPLLPVALIIVGASGVISMLLPYAAENYPLLIRGRATGWVAACSKLGGLAAQGLSVAGAVPPLAATALAIAVPAVGASLLIAAFGRESRGRSLAELDARAGHVPRLSKAVASSSRSQ